MQGVVSYKHDAWGNLIRRTETGANGTAVSDERYAVDGWDTAKMTPVGNEQFDTWADVDASGNALTRRLFGSGFDDVVARLSGSVVSWYGTDRQGSVRNIFDNSGNVIASSDFDAWGNVVAGMVTDRYSFTGLDWDGFAKLYIPANGRPYDAGIGRWLAGDEKGFAAGDVNLSRYVGNGPTNGVDPSGYEDPWWQRRINSAYGVLDSIGIAKPLKSKMNTLGQTTLKVVDAAQIGGEQIVPGRVAVPLTAEGRKWQEEVNRVKVFVKDNPGTTAKITGNTFVTGEALDSGAGVTVQAVEWGFETGSFGLIEQKGANRWRAPFGHQEAFRMGYEDVGSVRSAVSDTILLVDGVRNLPKLAKSLDDLGSAGRRFWNESQAMSKPMPALVGAGSDIRVGAAAVDRAGFAPVWEGLKGVGKSSLREYPGSAGAWELSKDADRLREIFGDGILEQRSSRANTADFLGRAGFDEALPAKYRDAAKIAAEQLGKRRIVGTPGVVTGGNSKTLGKNMIEQMVLPRSQSWTGYQAQHIIPSEMRTHPVIQKIGMDLDHPSNGMFLPTPDKEISTLSRHRGYHSVYSEVVERALSRIDVTKSVSQLEDEVFQLQQQLRTLSEQGTPLYPSKERGGATIDMWERRLK